VNPPNDLISFVLYPALIQIHKRKETGLVDEELFAFGQ
jgi:hypothetical protein